MTREERNFKRLEDDNGRYAGVEFDCDCGARLYAYGGDTDCDHCGALFNASGQRLVDPSLWEEPWDEY